MPSNAPDYIHPALKRLNGLLWRAEQMGTEIEKGDIGGRFPRPWEDHLKKQFKKIAKEIKKLSREWIG